MNRRFIILENQKNKELALIGSLSLSVKSSKESLLSLRAIGLMWLKGSTKEEVKFTPRKLEILSYMKFDRFVYAEFNTMDTYFKHICRFIIYLIRFENVIQLIKIKWKY